MTDALGRARSRAYNANSNIVALTDAAGMVTDHAYSTDGRFNLTGVTLATGAQASLDYADPNNAYAPSELVSPQGNALAYDYDAKGNLAGVTDATPQQGRTDVARRSDGQIATVTDPRGHTTSYGYDAAGHLTSVTPPAPRAATTIGYDALSRVVAVTDGNGHTTSYAYDPLDRLATVTFDGGATVTYTHDGAGNLLEQTDATGTRTYTYDRLNRRTREQLPEATHHYAWDPAGNLTAFSGRNGTVAYTHNPVNLLVELVEPGGNTTTFAYDADNRRTDTNYPGGVTQTAVYDAAGRLTRISGRDAAGGVLTDFAYTYTDPVSGADTTLRQTVTDRHGHTTGYRYDQLDRLIEAATTDASGTPVETWGYGWDAAGNRTSLTHDGVTVTADYDAANQLVRHGTFNYSHDAAGNLASGSDGTALGYNSANQTVSMQIGSGPQLDAGYAGQSQTDRIAAGDLTLATGLLGVASDRSPHRGDNHFTCDSAGRLVGRRVHAHYRQYYLFDGLGSVAALVNADGTVDRRYTYTPHGDTSASYGPGDSNPWRYTGEYQDNATGLYKIGHRYLHPALGRWTQPDPLHQIINPTRPPDANPYTYAACNPANNADPSGLHSCVNWWHLALAVNNALDTVFFAGFAIWGASMVPVSYGLTTVMIVAGGWAALLTARQMVDYSKSAFANC